MNRVGLRGHVCGSNRIDFDENERKTQITRLTSAQRNAFAAEKRGPNSAKLQLVCAVDWPSVCQRGCQRATQSIDSLINSSAIKQPKARRKKHKQKHLNKP